MTDALQAATRFVVDLLTIENVLIWCVGLFVGAVVAWKAEG